MTGPSLDIFAGHPPGWENPENLRATAALPAAGAWDATPTEQICAGADTILLAFTYTRGAAGGAFDWQIQVSPYSSVNTAPAGASEWIIESIYAGGAVVAGADTQSQVQREYENYGSQGAAAEAFLFGPIDLKSGVERIRIRARETGVAGTPGTLQVSGVMQT